MSTIKVMIADADEEVRTSLAEVLAQEPKNPAEYDAIILEFKVFNRRREKSTE